MTAEEFSTRLSRDCGVLPGGHVLVALSGGADSVALLCLFLAIAQKYPLRISCAHVEHGIRGEASLGDLAFVRALCEKKAVALYAAHVDAPGYAAAHGCGMEDAARTLRYDFLNQTADAIGADAIALAHHMHDQAETVLLHAMRGSDVRGLCAMRYRSGRLIRPLLDEEPDALRTYLREIGQGWREDETNADTAYLRNRVRHSVLPAMEAAMPGTQAALARLARAAQRDEDYFAKRIDALEGGWIPLIDGIAAEKEQLLGLHPALLSRVLVRMAQRAGISIGRASEIEAVVAALESDDAVINLAGGAHASLGRRYLCLTRAYTPDIRVKLCVPGVTDTPFGRFEVCPAREGETGDGKRSQRMAAHLLEGAYITNRREGDVIVPFGRNTPVKIKKLMIDAGVERAMRASMPVIRKEETVFFAVGLRAGECCRDSGNDAQMIVRFCGEWPCADMKKSIRLKQIRRILS